MDSRYNPVNRPSARPVVRLKIGYAHRFGLVCAFQLDRQGGGEALQWADLEADAEPEPHSAQGPVWIHLDLKHACAQRWLSAHSGIEHVCWVGAD